MIALTLGDFHFARGELPESIGFGASQQLHVHNLVGGARVIDALGTIPTRPEWSGWLVGPDAVARARRLKQLAEAGRPLALRFGEFAYTVMIASFSAEFRAGPNLPYSLALEVVRDHAAEQPRAGLPGLAQIVLQDVAAVVANAAALGDDGLTGAAGAVSAAANLPGSRQSNPAAIRPLTPAITAAQTQVARLDGIASDRLAAVGPLSAPGSAPDPLRRFVGALAAAADAAGQTVLLRATAQRLSRLAANLAAAAGGSGPVVTTGTTDLYHLAAARYGDARGWAWIAQANGLTDPAISQITQLVVPPAASAPATGVLHG